MDGRPGLLERNGIVPLMTGRQDDPVWEQALDWFMQVEARPDDARLRAARDAWMAEDAAHADAYRKAEKVWRLTGEVRPAHARRAGVETRLAPARSIHRRLVPVAVALAAEAVAGAARAERDT